MNREQMIENATLAMYNGDPRMAERYKGDGRKVLDAILPQVTTVEELEALPFDAKVISVSGEAWAHYRLATKGDRPLRWRSTRGAYGWTSARLASYGPLTVVWSLS